MPRIVRVSSGTRSGGLAATANTNVLRELIFSHNPRIPVVDQDGNVLAMLRFVPVKAHEKINDKRVEVWGAGIELKLYADLPATDDGRIYIRVLTPRQLRRMALSLLEYADRLELATLMGIQLRGRGGQGVAAQAEAAAVEEGGDEAQPQVKTATIDEEEDIGFS